MLFFKLAISLLSRFAISSLMDIITNNKSSSTLSFFMHDLFSELDIVL